MSRGGKRAEREKRGESAFLASRVESLGIAHLL